jgi:mono/diheme cytochrome c family protein
MKLSNRKQLLWGLVFAMFTGVAAYAEDAPATNPMSGDEQAIKKGRTLFRQVCSLCHGSKADGAGERGNGADLRKFNRGFKAYVETVQNGRSTRGQSQTMPAWKGIISDDEIMQVGAYLETLAMEGANWKEGSGTQ